MVAERKRRVKDGREFDHLFPPPSEIDTTIKKSADVEDTMKFIRRALPQTLWQTEQIANALKGRTLEETCSNIWHFVYEHIQYKRDDEGVEQVRSPRRAWWDRESGVDCDCYTVFILSILRSLEIDCLARITKYPKQYPEIPRWQHVYPIVPKRGHLEDYLDERDYYIVIDCVKDSFDDEQPYLECKDYDMRLDYLDGIDERGQETEMYETEYYQPDNADLSDLASVYDDEELEMGNVFKKIGKGIKKAAKKVGDTVGKGIRVINRFANPATILLRNGFLVAMKINLLNVGGRLRYAYLTDEQAKQKGINLTALKKIRSVRDRAETIYWQAGGKKSNLKKAILGGKGNKDKKVPLNGLSGLDDEYIDMDEYNIIHADPDNINGLGEIATGAALAAASGAVAAISGALKQIKGIFNTGGHEEKVFQSETENARSATSLPSNISEDEEKLLSPTITSKQSITTQTNNETTSASDDSGSDESDQSILPDTTASRSLTTTTNQTSTKTPAVPATEDKGLIQKTTTWVKENPGKSLLITGAVVSTTYLLVKAMSGGHSKANTDGLSGLPAGRHGLPRQQKRKTGKQKKNKTKHKVQKVQRLNLL